MTTLFRRRRVLCGFAASFWLVAATTALSAGQFGWLPGGDKSVKYNTYKDPAGRFEIEYPTKDWRILPTGGSSLAVFSRSDGPSLFIDQTRLDGVMTKEETEAMSEIEVSVIKEQWPKAKDFKSEMLESKSGRGILIRYSRPGTGADEQSVVQFSVPVGLTMYRLNGAMPQKLVSKHEAVVLHMIQSFTAAAGSTATKD